MTKGKNPQKNHPQQLLSDSVYTYDVEYPYDTDWWPDLLFAGMSQMFPEEQRGCHRQREEQIIYNTLIRTFSRIERETEKCVQFVDWLQKGLRYGPAIRDCRLSKNVQDIRQSHTG